MPAVSVIVLVYNAEKSIERCARGLFSQTLKDIEYVFLDDCSSDSSMEILNRVLNDYPHRRDQVKIIRNEVNRGQAYSRRRGVEAACGDYIIHCDSDDWPDPEMYARLYSKALEGNFDIVICRMRRVYDDHIKPVSCVSYADDLLEALLYQDVHHYLLDKLVSRTLYEAPIIWPEKNMCEDTAIIIQLAYYCEKWGFVDAELYNYCYSPDGISSRQNTKEKVEQIRSNVGLAISFLDSKGLSAKYKRAITHLKGWNKLAAFPLPRRYYMSLYPEANSSIYFDNRFTIAERLGHMTKMFGIHGVSKLFLRK